MTQKKHAHSPSPTHGPIDGPADADGRIEPTIGPADAPAQPAVTAAPDLGQLQAELASARAEAAEAKDKFLRAKAETENVRRRAEADVANAHKYGIERFAMEMLAVRDSLELAKGVDRGQTGIVDKVLEGVDLTLKLMDSGLEKFGLTIVDPAGQKFDPAVHQAMTMQESDTVAPNHVLQVMQKGCLLNGRLLRPALVVVAKAKSEAGA